MQRVCGGGVVTTSAPIRPILRYPGGKARIAPWIVEHLPPHACYVEPFAGGASVLMAKPRSDVEVLNDLDGRIVNLFRVIREQPDALIRAIALTPYARSEYDASDDVAGDSVEDARRFLCRVWMAHAGRLAEKPGFRCGFAGSKTSHRGSIARVWTTLPDRLAAVCERISEVLIECRPALRVIADWCRDDVVLYLDPPYLWETRDRTGGSRGRHYTHEMTDQDHVELLQAIQRHPGPVVISGYRSPLYDEHLADWRRVEIKTRAYRQAERTEVLWMNPVAAATARQQPLMEAGS